MSASKCCCWRGVRPRARVSSADSIFCGCADEAGAALAGFCAALEVARVGGVESACGFVSGASPDSRRNCSCCCTTPFMVSAAACIWRLNSSSNSLPASAFKSTMCEGGMAPLAFPLGAGGSARSTSFSSINVANASTVVSSSKSCVTCISRSHLVSTVRWNSISTSELAPISKKGTCAASAPGAAGSASEIKAIKSLRIAARWPSFAVSSLT